jgi:hypothetical protein
MHLESPSMDAVVSLVVALIVLVAMVGMSWWYNRVPVPELRLDELLIRKSQATLAIDTLLPRSSGYLYLTTQRVFWRRPRFPLVLGSLLFQPQDILLRDIEGVVVFEREETAGSSGFFYSRKRLRNGTRTMSLEIDASGHRLFFQLQHWNPLRIHKTRLEWAETVLSAKASGGWQSAPHDASVVTPLSVGQLRRFRLWSLSSLAIAGGGLIVAFVLAINGEFGGAGFAAFVALLFVLAFHHEWSLSSAP